MVVMYNLKLQLRGLLNMSTLANETLLENIYEELAEEFPTLTDQELHDLTIKKFEDLQ